MMIKKIYILTVLLVLIALNTNGQRYEAGVSKELAETRMQTISNVHYDLTFNIPYEQQKAVSGRAVVRFALSQPTEVALDFQGQFSGDCTVNGKKRTVAVENEHIVIPSRYLTAGTNAIELEFTSSDKALNRYGEYMYTLFVPDQARSCFPCFDQPDLRATFSTTLHVPEGWKTIASDGRYPIPTYLYSFVAGQFEEKRSQREGYKIRALYREQSPQKVEQIDKIFDEVGSSLQWMEHYTGIKCPFEEYGMVILPGYQFGGMEHPGAIQLTDRRLFLGTNPSKDEELSRMELIAHETAHLWFGDMVSLKWFEDVWTKEVFANFMASKITRRQFSKVDHDLNFLKTYQARAIAIDRTAGTHPIAQELKNLNHASLLYDDIIYDKAPVMMRILENMMGAEQLQAGLQAFLQKYFFKNASWDDLIETLDRQNPMAGVRQFSEVWVKQKGLPTIHTSYRDGQLIVSQQDPYGRGLFWRQKFEVRLIYDLDESRTITIDMNQPTVSVNLSKQPNCIIPNYTGRGYGRFTLDEAYTKVLPLRLMVTRGDLHRYALLLTLHDNYLMGRIPASYFGELYRSMCKEKNPLIMQTAIDHMLQIASDRPATERQTLEQCVMDLLAENKSGDCRQIIFRKMAARATAPEVLNQVYQVWNAQSDPLFNEHDYMEMAYRLAMMRPRQWQSITNRQLGLLKSETLRQEFSYVSRACTPDKKAQQQLFRTIVEKENRQHEPWALHALRLLSDDTREPHNNSYILESLNALEYIQQSSDIFFAGNWLNTLLARHKSREALHITRQFMDQHPTLQQNLFNKINVAVWPLQNYRERSAKQ